MSGCGWCHGSGRFLVIDDDGRVKRFDDCDRCDGTGLVPRVKVDKGEVHG